MTETSIEQRLEPLTEIPRCVLAIPGSKSISNRALLLAALATGRSQLSGVLRAGDVTSMLEALRGLGVAVEFDPALALATVQGTGGPFPASSAAVFCGEGATVARFLLAACAGGVGTYRFDAAPSLRRRPIGPLVAALQGLGARFQPLHAEHLPLTLEAAGLRGGRIQVDSELSSQFLSALLMASPMAESPIEVATELSASEPYVELTRSMMVSFGVPVFVPGPGRYLVQAPASYSATAYEIEADASTASYFFAAAAATGGEVTVQNISREACIQGDIHFLEILEEMGCEVQSGPTGTTVRGPDRLLGVEANMHAISDTFMTLACLAPFANGPTTINGIAHTRVKESDRIAATVANLGRLGVRAEELPDGIRIHPGGLGPGVVESYSDHRQVMAFAILGLRQAGIVIRGAEAVEKTCPDFFELWAGLRKRTPEN